MEDNTITDSFEADIKGYLFNRPKDSGFIDVAPEDKGLAVKEFTKYFTDNYNITDEKQLEAINDRAAKLLEKEKVSLEINRYRPTPEDAAVLFPETPVYTKGQKIEDYIKRVNDWIPEANKQSASFRPADKTDLELYTQDMANAYIRDAAGKANDTGFLWDKTSRLMEGAVKPFTDLIDKPWSDRFFAENLAENPERDTDLSSQFAAGAGQLASQIVIGSIISATAGPEAVLPAFSLLYGAQYVKNGYEEEFKRSGDSEKALAAGVSQIPASFLDATAESFLLHSGGVVKGIGKQILAAGSLDAKRAILTKALPTLTKTMLQQVGTEGFVGGIGAEFASGYGAYMATGDESYLRSTKQLLESGLVEGTLGALFGGGMQIFSRGGQLNLAAQDINKNISFQSAKQSDIFDALKAKDYTKAIQIAQEARAQFPYNIASSQTNKNTTKQPFTKQSFTEQNQQTPQQNYREELKLLRTRLKSVQDNPEELKRIQDNITKLSDPNYTPGLYESGVVEQSPIFDGHIVYVKATPGQLNGAALAVGTNKINLDEGATELSFTGNGSKPGTIVNTKPFKVSPGPKEGYIAVKVTDSAVENGIVRKLELVKEEVKKEEKQLPLTEDEKKTLETLTSKENKTPEEDAQIKALNDRLQANINVEDKVVGIKNEQKSFVEEKLPVELSKASPKYNFGTVSAIPNFTSDFDKAAYIVSGKNKSKKHDDYLNWAKSISGLTEEEIVNHGEKVRQNIKDRVKNGESGNIDISSQYNIVQNTKLDRSKAKIAKFDINNPPAKSTTSVEEKQTKVDNLKATKPVREDSKRQKALSKPEFGKEGYRITDENKEREYSKKGGWKLHLAVSPENYSKVDKWLYNNHKGIYKLLQGGDAGHSDFTIYIGDKKTANNFAEKINKEIGELINDPELDGDTLLSGKVAARFDIQKTGKDNPYQYYGTNGIPGTEYSQSLYMELGFARKSGDISEVLKLEDKIRKEFEKHHKDLEKRYGNFYTGKTTHTNKTVTNNNGVESSTIEEIPNEGVVVVESFEKLKEELAAQAEAAKKKYEEENKKKSIFDDEIFSEVSDDTKEMFSNAEQQGAKIVVVENNKEAAKISGKAVKKGSRGFSQNINGTPTIVIVKSEVKSSNKKVSFNDFLQHEIFHIGSLIVANQNEELHNSAQSIVDSKSKEFDKNLDTFMSKEYNEWNKLSNRQKFEEAVRAIIEGRYKGKTSSSSFKKYLKKFLDYINNLFISPANNNLQDVVTNIENVLGITKENKQVSETIQEVLQETGAPDTVALMEGIYPQSPTTENATTKGLAEGAAKVAKGEEKPAKSVYFNSLTQEEVIVPTEEFIYTPEPVQKTEEDYFVDTFNEYTKDFPNKNIWTASKIKEAWNYIQNKNNIGTLTKVQTNTANNVYKQMVVNQLVNNGITVEEAVSKFEKEFYEKPDKVTREFLAKERDNNKKNEEFKQSLDEEVAGEHRYSIAGKEGGGITKEETDKFISDLGLPITVVDTNKLTEDGHLWSGRTDFNTVNGKAQNVRITINIANIRDVEHLKNVINEELAHTIYNDETLRPLIDDIINTSTVDQNLLDKYQEDDLTEESAVRFVADLVDLYDKKGSIDKFITALKTWFKKTFGLTLKESELSYIASKAIRASLKRIDFNNGATSDSRYSLAGIKAQVADQGALQKAISMAGDVKIDTDLTEEQRQKIWKETGWYLGADGKWRFEIDDSKAGFKDQIGIFSSQIPISLWTFFKHDKLFNAYPEIKELKVSFDILPNGTDGKFTNNKIIISKKIDKKEKLSVLLHEIQHWIQAKEGFSLGSNKVYEGRLIADKKLQNEYAKLKEYSGIFNKIKENVEKENPNLSLSESIEKTKEIILENYYFLEKQAELAQKRIIEESNNYDENEAFQNYRKTLGEIEARDTQNRNYLTSEQKKNLPPFSDIETENMDIPVYPREMWIIRDSNNGTSFSVEPNQESSETDSQESTTETNTNINSNEEVFDIDEILNGKISAEKRAAIKEVGKLRKTKIEQDLIVDEKQALNLLNQVNVTFLPNDQALEFTNLIGNFVETRSRQKEPPLKRQESAKNIIKRAQELIKISNQGQFDYIQSLYSDLEEKTFEGDFESDLKLLADFIKQLDNRDETFNVNISEEELNVEERLQHIQELARENNDIVLQSVNRMANEVAFKTDNESLKEFVPLLKELGSESLQKRLEFFTDYANSLLSDIEGLTFKQKRQKLYALHSLFADGYPLYANNFISTQTQQILQQKLEGKIFPYISAEQAGAITEKITGFAPNIRRLGPQLSNLIFKLVSPFREGVQKSEVIQEKIIKPYLKKAIKRAQRISGFNYNQRDLNKIGLYSYLVAYKTNETQSEGIKRNKEYIKESISHHSEHFDKSFEESSQMYLDLMDTMLKGIDLESANPIDQLMQTTELDEGMKGYHKDIIDMFEMIKPLTKFNTEFVYGRPFEEWVNYVPAFSVRTDSESVSNPKHEILSMDSDSHALGELDQDKDMTRNVQTRGMSATKDRTRRLGKHRVLVFNINQLSESRMRLNLLDIFTAIERRELVNLLDEHGSENKTFHKWLNPEGKNSGRDGLIYRTVLQSWQHSIQGASFSSKYDVFINQLTRLIGSVKLSSLYQLPGQLFSNVVPFFVVNINNPQKMARFFKSLVVLAKYRSGKLDQRSAQVVERLIRGIEMRKQDQFLDKSIKLNVTGKEMFQTFKSSPLFSLLQNANEVREAVMFFQFKYSDMWSGDPVILAEYLSNEIDAGRGNENWDGITYNEESYFKALDETERFIGIGSATRRGAYMHNGKWPIVMLRNMLTNFASHRVNNATNFEIEMNQLRSGALTPEQRNKSIRYMMAIAAQSVTFGAIKWGVTLGIFSVIRGALEEDENEDKLKSLYRKLANTNPEDAKKIQAEISMRQNIRSEWDKVRNRTEDKGLLAVNIVSDTVANSFVIPAGFDFLTNYVIHLTYDKHEEQQFNDVKKEKLESLTRKIKNATNLGDYHRAAELTLEKKRVDSQEAVLASFENRGYIPFQGSYGMAFKDIANFGEAVVDSVMKPDVKALTKYDLSLIMGAAGVMQSDIQKYLRMEDKILSQNMLYDKKIKELKEKARKEARGQ